MKLARLMLVVGLLVPAAAFAADPDARQAADELLTLTNVEGMLAGVRAQTGRALESQIGALQLSESQQAAAARLQERVLGLLAEEMSFAKMKESYVEAYTSVFTKDELIGLVAFYRTPLGQAYVKKLPEMSTRLMEISRDRVNKLEPEIKKMTADFAAELNKPPASN